MWPITRAGELPWAPRRSWRAKQSYRGELSILRDDKVEKRVANFREVSKYEAESLNFKIIGPKLFKPVTLYNKQGRYIKIHILLYPCYIIQRITSRNMNRWKSPLLACSMSCKGVLYSFRLARIILFFYNIIFLAQLWTQSTFFKAPFFSIILTWIQ